MPTPSYPSNVATVTVTGNWGPSATGLVTFVPNALLADGTSAPPQFLPQAEYTVTAALVNGAISVTLMATDDTHLSPSGWVYTVTENLTGQPNRTYNILLPAAVSPVDLTAVAKPVTPPALVTYVPLSTVSAKGDLIVATGLGAVARQAVGSDGQVLSADSTQVDGVRWVTLNASSVGAVATTRQITAGAGLSGGGDLTADRSFAVQFGATAGTVAQGDDARIVGAVQAANNLSDLANPATARINLGAAADSAAVHKTGDEEIAGRKTFDVSPTIPQTPSAATDAASKGYVDSGLAAKLATNKLPVHSVGGKLAILTIMVYHTVPSASTFNTDLDYYQEWNYVTVTPDQVAAFIDGTGTLPAKPLLITFDDGYASQWTNAYPGLQSRGMTATWYVCTGWLDGTVSQGQGSFLEATALTWSQCQTMFANGMRIQSHTTNHVDQTTLTAAQVQADFAAAKARIEAQVPGETCGHLAYPYGAWNATVEQGLIAAGCRTARVVRINAQDGSYPGPNQGRYAYALLGLHDRYALPSAGTGFGDIMQPNFNRNLTPDPELIPDYGFEAGGKGWTLGTGFVFDSSVKNSGKQSLRCDEGTSTVSAKTTRLIPVGPYCKITGSVWINTVGLPSNALTKVQYQIYRPDGQTVYQTVDAVTITGNNGAWTNYTWNYYGDINSGFLQIYCWLQGSSAAGAPSPSGSAWYDDLSLHRDGLPSPLVLPY